MSSTTSFLQPQNYVSAGSALQYSMQLLDLAGVPLGSGQVSALTLSLIDVASNAVVNSVSLVNILNTGRGTLDVNGNCVITLTAADTALVVTTDTFEMRSMVIDWTFSGKAGRHRVDFGIVGMPGSQPN